MREKLARVDWRVATICAICIMVMEVTALVKGVDGFCFGLAVAAIAGIGGFVVRGWLK